MTIDELIDKLSDRRLDINFNLNSVDEGHRLFTAYQYSLWEYDYVLRLLKEYKLSQVD